jgi:hypothetical protein
LFWRRHSPSGQSRHLLPLSRDTKAWMTCIKFTYPETLDTQGDKIRCDNAWDHLKTESAGEEIRWLSKGREEDVEWMSTVASMLLNLCRKCWMLLHVLLGALTKQKAKGHLMWWSRFSCLSTSVSA